MKRLLLVTDEFVWPAFSGSRLRTWNFIEALRGHYDLHLVHSYRTPPDSESLAHARRYFSTIQGVPDLRPAVTETARDWLRRRVDVTPFQLRKAHIPGFADAITATLERYRFDVVLARYIYQARYLFERTSKIHGRIVVDLDDIETLKIRRLRRLNPARSGIQRFKDLLNEEMFARYHRRNLPSADVSLVCSAGDRRHLLARRWTRNAEVVPNAVDVARLALGERRDGCDTLLFCGMLAYEPNVDGILWFVREVLPLIKKRKPNVRVLIVGRSPAREVQALVTDSAIQLHANVEDVRPFYEQSSVVIVPIRSGGGTRLKVLEAGACRRPVVSTSIGVEGLQLVAGRHCLVDDEAGGFADKCVDALEDDVKARRLVMELFEHVCSEYDTPRVQDRIRQIFLTLDRDNASPIAVSA